MLLCSTSATNTAQVTHSVSDNHYVIHECYYVAHQRPTLHKLLSASDNHYVIHECYYVAHQQPTLHKLLTVSVTIIMSFMNVIM